MKNRGLNVYACLGNRARVMTGQAAGARGVVTGKSGRFSEQVIVHFPKDGAREDGRGRSDRDPRRRGGHGADRASGRGAEEPVAGAARGAARARRRRARGVWCHGADSRRTWSVRAWASPPRAAACTCSPPTAGCWPSSASTRCAWATSWRWKTPTAASTTATCAGRVPSASSAPRTDHAPATAPASRSSCHRAGRRTRQLHRGRCQHRRLAGARAVARPRGVTAARAMAVPSSSPVGGSRLVSTITVHSPLDSMTALVPGAPPAMPMSPLAPGNAPAFAAFTNAGRIERRRVAAASGASGRAPLVHGIPATFSTMAPSAM